MMKVSQMLDMQHAIGYAMSKVKRKRYTTYRNYFTTGERHADWDDLVEQGYAERAPFPHGGGKDPQMYRVTQNGVEELERVLHIKIELDEE